MAKITKASGLEICFLVAIAIGILLRIINLDSREFWYDEVLSLLLSTGQKKLYSSPGEIPLVIADYKQLLSLPIENSFADIITTLEKLIKGLVAEPHPPLFYLGQHFWLRLWGNSVAAMRSLPVLYSIGAIFCSYGLGRKLLGYRGGLLLAAALSLNPFFLFHSLNVRMYCGLVFWVVLSGWATIELIEIHQTEKGDRETINLRKNIIWSLILVASVAGGFLTFYYFGFWLASLGILVIAVDIFGVNKNTSSTDKNKLIGNFLQSRQWLQQSILIFSGFALTIPWLLWGTRQQFNNADLGRFKVGNNILETIGNHIAGILTALGNNLIVGDWASILSPSVINLAGAIALIVLIISLIYLWQKQKYQLLITTFALSLLPLFLVVTIDVLTGKFTVGFGFGRSLILIIPGCLLLLVAAIVKLPPRQQTINAIALLAIYLTISLSDLSFRSRSMFHNLTEIVQQQPNTPTLILLNTKAWGHVLRLVYYLPENPNLELLAQPAAQLNPALTKALDNTEKAYQRVIWLDSDRPVWGKPTTEIQQQIITKTIEQKFQLQTQTKLTGTWELDNFDLQVYQLSEQ